VDSSRRDGEVRKSNLFPDLREVPGGQLLQVGPQGAGVQHLLEAVAVVRGAEQDVVPEGGVLYPRLLGHVGHRPLETGREMNVIDESVGGL